MRKPFRPRSNAATRATRTRSPAGTIAGALSPLLSHSGMTLAIGAGALMASGLLCWIWYAAITPAAQVEKPVELSEETVEPV